MPVSAEVPFKIFNGRKCLTFQQLDECPWLEAFVNKFRNQFELDGLRQVYFLVAT